MDIYNGSGNVIPVGEGAKWPEGAVRHMFKALRAGVYAKDAAKSIDKMAQLLEFDENPEEPETGTLLKDWQFDAEEPAIDKVGGSEITVFGEVEFINGAAIIPERSVRTALAFVHSPLTGCRIVIDFGEMLMSSFSENGIYRLLQRYSPTYVEGGMYAMAYLFHPTNIEGCTDKGIWALRDNSVSYPYDGQYFEQDNPWMIDNARMSVELVSDSVMNILVNNELVYTGGNIYNGASGFAIGALRNSTLACEVKRIRVYQI